MKTIGLVGFGYWGPNYARICSALSAVHLKWICDLDKKLLLQAKRKYPNVLVTNSFFDLISDKIIDGLIIATPTSTHTTLVSLALQSRKHVLVEKPLTTSLREAQKLISMAKKYRRILLVGHTYLFHSVVAYLKSAVKEGSLGKLRFIFSQRTNLGPVRTDANVLWDLAPHDVSTILYLVENKVMEVNAAGSSYLNKHIEDVVNVNLKFQNGVFANILVSWLAPVKVRMMSVVGEKQMAVFDDLGPEQLRLFERSIYPFGKGETANFKDFKNFFIQKHKNVMLRSTYKEPLEEQVRHFIQLLSGKSSLTVSHEHVSQVTQVLEAADRSLKIGKRVRL